MAKTDASITIKSPAYMNRLIEWRKVRDTLEGEETIKERGTDHLPKPKGQDTDQYAAYKKRASFFDVTERTLRGLMGMVFRIEPRIALPAPLESLLESATPDGSPLALVVREAVRENSSVGRMGVLVDMAQEELLDQAPYLATYMAEDIFKWEEKMKRGRRELTRVVLQDASASSEEETTHRILELTLGGDGFYVMRVFEAVEKEDRAIDGQDNLSLGFSDIITAGYELKETHEPKAQGKRLERIPFWFINTYDNRARTSKPPMLALSSMNTAHYRNSADMEHSLFLTACPTPWCAGASKDSTPTTIGPTTIWLLPANGRAGILEFSGAGIGAIRQAMLDKENRMAVLGARLIAEETRNVTAETTRLNARSESSTLNEAVAHSEAGLIMALRFAAEWVGANPDDVEISINRDYVETRMEPTELTALVASWQLGAYSRQTLHENLQRGEIIDPSRTLEEELELIENEGGEDEPDQSDEFQAEMEEVLARLKAQEAQSVAPDDSGGGDGGGE